MHAFLLSLLLAINPSQTDGGTVGVKGQRFLAEVARTDQEKAKGLMYRTNLAKDRCMFFVYEEDGYHPIWMGNCRIALDVVWVKADGTVVEIKENAPPLPITFRASEAEAPSYGGKVLSRYFLEFAAGTVRRLKLQVGERIGWELQFKDGSGLTGGAPLPKEGGKAKKTRKK
jgi:uncharacterized membrane protein (UPF0127 family)